VEVAAVAAARRARHGEPDQLLVLVRDRGLVRKCEALEARPLGRDQVVRNLLEELGHQPERGLNIAVYVSPVLGNHQRFLGSQLGGSAPAGCITPSALSGAGRSSGLRPIRLPPDPRVKARTSRVHRHAPVLLPRRYRSRRSAPSSRTRRGHAAASRHREQGGGTSRGVLGLAKSGSRRTARLSCSRPRKAALGRHAKPAITTTRLRVVTPYAWPASCVRAHGSEVVRALTTFSISSERI